MYGLNAARQPDGEANVDLMLGEYRKLDPGPVEEFVFFDHPSGRTRITAAMRWKAEHPELASPENWLDLFSALRRENVLLGWRRTSNVSASRTGVGIAKLSSAHKPNGKIHRAIQDDKAEQSRGGNWRSFERCAKL